MYKLEYEDNEGKTIQKSYKTIKEIKKALVELAGTGRESMLNDVFNWLDTKMTSNRYYVNQLLRFEVEKSLGNGIEIAENESSKTKSNYNKAVKYAEHHGIVEGKVKNNCLIWNVSYPAYINEPHYTVQHTLNLDTLVESTKRLKKFDRRGIYNRN